MLSSQQSLAAISIPSDILAVSQLSPYDPVQQTCFLLQSHHFES